MTMKLHLSKQFAALGTKWSDDLLFRTSAKLTTVYLLMVSALVVSYSYFLYQEFLLRMEDAIDERVADFSVRSRLIDQAADLFQDRLIMFDLCALLFLLVCGYLLIRMALRPVLLARVREQRFIADAAHELRTPLAVIKSGSEVALRVDPTMSVLTRNQLVETVAEVDSLTQLANNLLLLTRGKSVGPVHQHVHVGLLVADVVRRLGSVAQGVQITCVTVPDAASKTAITYGDRAALMRAFSNVLENAIKYNKPEGAIVVTVHLVGARVLVTVADTGIGIAAHDLAHIQEPFFRVDHARTADQGAGLGLAIVSEIVRAHGGTVSISSILGTGTTVEISLPRAA
jgi:signal transduction histidine kinase